MNHFVKLWVIVGLAFLALPLLVIVPLSFTSGHYMVYTCLLYTSPSPRD